MKNESSSSGWNKEAFLTTLLVMIALYAHGAAVQHTLAMAERLEQEGNFKEAAALFESASRNSEATAEEKRIAGFELDRMNRVRRDFPLTREKLLRELKTAVDGLTEAEFDGWVREGRFDSRVIDGVRYFMSSSVSNLFFRHSELNKRRIPPKHTKDLEFAKLRIAESIRTAARKSGSPYVLPKTFEATMTVTVKPGGAEPSQSLRAWLPVPRAYPFQTGFQVVSSSPPMKALAPENSPIRSAYFEQQADKEGSGVFTIVYRYTAHGVSFDLDPSKARLPGSSAELAPFTREAPHIVFTPEMRKLAKEIAGDEKNPLLRAKRYYDWIGENIKYSYAIEYSTIRNIGEYCRSKGYGDCGQEALLFMTLCRLDGIPARWQSGWNLFPGAKTIHDWSEIYLEPWGWFPVDPYMSIFATRYATSLTPEQRRQLRDFYFGGLDQYRMAANSDHNQELTPAKQGYRSDTVDFQRGEIDAGSKNVYFDKFSFKLDYKEIF